jgi:aspartyl-tRNA(Asn)/glutamyl-tRNA(Gln) amidotransferase subunit A
LPAISIPCGLSDELPVGFQIIGPAFSENRILDAAHALEQAIDFVTAPPLRDTSATGGSGNSVGGRGSSSSRQKERA